MRNRVLPDNRGSISKAGANMVGEIRINGGNDGYIRWDPSDGSKEINGGFE